MIIESREAIMNQIKVDKKEIKGDTNEIKQLRKGMQQMETDIEQIKGNLNEIMKIKKGVDEINQVREDIDSMKESFLKFSDRIAIEKEENPSESYSTHSRECFLFECS